VASPAERLRRRIEAEGSISFAAFMEEALYGEGGYYARPDLRIGERGDFVTGSSLSPLFGRSTARLLQALDVLLEASADLLEVGYGSGAHLGGVRAALPPGERRLLGCDRVARELPAGVRGLRSLDQLAASELQGLVFSYELFDALPVHRLVMREGALREIGVRVGAEGAFEWMEGPASKEGVAALPDVQLQEGQIADVAPGWRPLYRSLAERLGRGLLVTCDYGFETARLFDPRVRMHGTLACYRAHRVHRDPFVAVGEQDLTAHVDLSVLIDEGEQAGLRTFALTRQAPWLAATGLLEGLESASRRERLEAMQLMQLDGMGEEIRVLVQGREIEWKALGSALPGLKRL